MIDLFSKVNLIPLKDLVPHEEHYPKKSSEISKYLMLGPIYNLAPIIIDQKTKMIIDGHHRFQALIEAKKSFAPCVLINYQKKEVFVFKKAIGGQLIDKNEILSKAFEKKLYPQKFTCHAIEISQGEFVHISKLVNPTEVPLQEL